MNKKILVLFAVIFALSLFVNADIVELNGTANVTVNQTNFGVNPPSNLQIHYNSSDLNDWLNWTEASGADGYYVYYSSDLAYILSLDEFTVDPANVTLVGQTNTTWYDYDANLSTRKFYQVAAYSGASRNFSSYAVGRHSVLINSTSNFFAFQVEEDASLSERIPSTSNFDRIYAYVGGVLIARYFGFGQWRDDSGTPNDLGINFSVGYYTLGFASAKYFTAVGRIPVGAINQTIVAGNMFFGTESFQDLSLMSVLPVTSNFNRIYAYNGFSTLLTRYFGFGQWRDDSGVPSDLLLMPDYGYWTTNWASDSNMTYVRNP